MQDDRASNWEELIGRIDRRIVYVGLFLITLSPLIFGWQLPLYVTDPPRQLHATIEEVAEVAPDKLVVIASNWDAGTQAENRPQMIAIVRHLIRRDLKFVVLSIGQPQAPQLAHTAVEEAIALEGADWQYGRDWANLGFKLADLPWLRSFVRNIPEAIREDRFGTPVTELAVMDGVQRFGAPDDPNAQASMMVDITGSATIDVWYEFLSPSRAKIVLGCTAVMAPEQYPFLDSGQLAGMLTGMKGAAEYEQIADAPGLGLAAMAGQSFAHLYIIFLIVLGNLSIFFNWRARRGGRNTR